LRNRFILTPSFMGEALAGLLSSAKPGWFINKPSLPGGDKQFRMATLHRIIADFVLETVGDNQRPVSIAGDCCAAIGVLAGLQRAGIHPSLIWFDAHGDFNTWETTPSGFLGGMPLAMIVGKGEQSLPEAAGLKALPEDRVILTDARDLDAGERELIIKSAVLHLPKAETLLEHPLPDGPVCVHFDTDVVAGKESPAHNHPARGGPSSASIRSVFNRLARSGQVIAVSVSSWNPELDKEKKSETVSMSLLQALIGQV
jgi:arginase